jgi:hypothetical protein
MFLIFQIYLGLCLFIFLNCARLWYQRRKAGTLEEYAGRPFGVHCFMAVILYSFPIVNLMYVVLGIILILGIGILDYKEKAANDLSILTNVQQLTTWRREEFIQFDGKLIPYVCTFMDPQTNIIRVHHCNCGTAMNRDNAVVSNVEAIGWIMTCANCGNTVGGDSQAEAVDLWNSHNPTDVTLAKLDSKYTVAQYIQRRIIYALTYFTIERETSHIFPGEINGTTEHNDPQSQGTA